MKLSRTVIIAFIITVSLTGILASAQAQIKIESPESGATVRSVAKIRVTGTEADSGGWISFQIQPSGEEYVAATTFPFELKWNTQLRDENDKQVYPDGRYTVAAVAYDGSGKELSQDSVRLDVANSIRSSEVGAPLLLRSNYRRGPRLSYKVEGSGTVTVPGEAGKAIRERGEQMMGGPGMGPPAMRGPMGQMGPGMGGPMGQMGPGIGGPMGQMGPGIGRGGPMGAGMPGMGGGMGMGAGMGGEAPTGNPSTVDFDIEGTWYEECLSPTETGRAVVDKDFVKGYFSISWLWPKTQWQIGLELKEEKNVPDGYAQILPTAGQEYRFKIFPRGLIEKMHDDQLDFALGQIFIELPDEPVTTGSTWGGDMAVLMGPNSIRPKIVIAKHTLENFEYKGKYRCARIVSKYEETDTTVDWDFLTRTTAPAGGMGGPGTLGGPAGAAVPGGAMPGRMPGAAGPGMLGGGMPGAGAPPMPGVGMRAPGAFPGGAGGGMGAMGLAAMPLKGDISVERVSYFAIDEGRVVAIKDKVKLTIKSIPSEIAAYRRSGEIETREMSTDIYVADAEGLIASLIGATAGGGMMGAPGGPSGVGMMPPPMAGGGRRMPPGFGGYGGAMGPPGMPGYGQPGMPGYGQPGMPGYGQPGMPGYGQPGVPGYGQPGMPGYGQPGMPGYGQPGMPGYGQPGVPGYGPGAMPGYGMGVPGGMGMGMGMGVGMGMMMPIKATIEITANWLIYQKGADIHTHAVAWEKAE